MTPRWDDAISRYVESDLIAYIGNKRRLLPLLRESLSLLPPLPKGATFVDAFAGTGVVSRLATTQGFRVVSNDWESYTQPILKTYLTLKPADLTGMFQAWGGLDALLEELNHLPPPPPKDRYLSKFYAPANTQAADPTRERLFYTQENAQRLDAVRSFIRETYEQRPLSPKERAEKNVLLALLIQQASQRSNTNGVFKAYHHGFGGRKRDALGRILAPIQLKSPQLWDHQHKNLVTQADAVRLVDVLAQLEPVDVLYLDPPYNQHQYGSNYHLLTTVARGDRPHLPRYVDDPAAKGMKAGIRQDWKQTKSPFCNAKQALAQLDSLIEATDARHVLLSCSNEGFLAFDAVQPSLSRHGKLEVVAKSYTRYRGGRQAVHTASRNVEMVVICDTAQQRSRVSARRLLTSQIVSRLRQPTRAGSTLREHPWIQIPEAGIRLKLRAGLYWQDRQAQKDELSEPQPLELILATLSLSQLNSLHQFLAEHAIDSREDEVALALRSLETMIHSNQSGAAMQLLRQSPGLVAKFSNAAQRNQQWQVATQFLRLASALGNASPESRRSLLGTMMQLQRHAATAQSFLGSATSNDSQATSV